MLGLSVFSRLLSGLDGSPLTLVSEACLNSWHKDAGCRRCIESCPRQALTQGDGIEIHADMCVTCGICWRVCPTEALTLKNIDDRKLLSQIPLLLGEASHVELSCPRAMKDGAIESGNQSILELACLGQLSPGVLIAIVAAGAEAVWLNDSPCPECELGGTHAIVRRTIAITRDLLGAFGKEQSIFCYQDSAGLFSADSAGSSAMRVRADDIVYSRRDLFRLLRAGGTWELTKAMSGMMDDILPIPQAGLPEQRLPGQRLILARLLPRLGKPSPCSLNLSSLPAAQVEIQGECSACGLCSKFCPTGALRNEVQEGKCKLTFAAIYCVACGICQRVCPSYAIHLSDEVEVERLVNLRGEVLRQCELASCAMCGTACSSTGPEPLCFVCRKKARQRGQPYLISQEVS